MNIHQVLLRPTITEKSTLLQESGKYTFRVAPRANKMEVKEAVEKNFGVTVLDVNITKLHGKGFDRIVIVATSPSAVTACQRAIEALGGETAAPVELLTWLDVS